MVRLRPRRSALLAQARDPGLLALWGVLAVVATLGIGVWFVRDAALGDVALIEMETRRVFSASPPLLGAYSRYGWRHPGPALFGVLAVPYRAFGADARALATGALLVNATAMVSAILLARRRGAAAAGVVAAMLLLLVHGMGTDGIGSAWNVSVTLVPLVLVVVACWSSLCGDRWGPPAALLAYVFVAQAHVGNGVAITPVVLLTAGWMLVSAEHRRSLRSSGALAVSAVIAGVALVPIVIDVARDPPGNIGHLLRWSVHHDEAGAAWGDTLRLLGRTSSLSFPVRPEQPRFVLDATADASGVLPGGSVLVLAAVAVAAWRARHTTEAKLCTLMLAWWGAAVVAVRSIAGPLAWWLVEWLQPLGWLTVGAIALTAWRLWGPTTVPWARAAWPGVLLALTAVAVTGQIRTLADWRSRELVAAIPVEVLADAAEAAARPDGLVLELDGPDFAGEVMLAGVVNELDRRDVQVCVEPRLAYKFPPGVDCSSTGMTHLMLRTEAVIEPAPPDTARLAVADALDPATRARADDIRGTVLAALRADDTPELAAVVDNMLIADVLLETPSPAIAALEHEIRWLDAVYSAPHTRYAIYQGLIDTAT